jgi:D-alanyl-lipoteichoic acid acyltransferase DltB (MBOAT superfamily)
MTFNSYTFAIFLAVVVIVSRLIGGWPARKFFLLLSSYVFYAAWNAPFVVLLWISTVIDWHVSKRLHTADTARAKRLLLLVSLVSNLGILAYFKYGGMIVQSLNYSFRAAGLDLSLPGSSIILPVGISFYTFQTMSYTLDVYRGRLAPWDSFLDFALYVTFFPQLVAGPIVRATDFLPQCNEAKKGTFQQIVWGLSLLIIGLFCKVVVADSLMAPIADKVFGHVGSIGAVTSWAGVMAFSVQIFCDFFGYSICAIGIALCLGFSLPDNFRWPYASIGFSDFWKRWHISLSSWLKDYLYIPLGGNRCTTGRCYANLMLTMLLGGLWHGASWMFVVWGGLHGAFLVVERALRSAALPGRKILGRAPFPFLLSVVTYLAVCLTWVFFRARSIGDAFQLCRHMLDPLSIWREMLAVVSGSTSVWEHASYWLDRRLYMLVLVCVSATLLIHWVLRNSNLEHAFSRVWWPFRSMLLGVLLYLVLISSFGPDRAFIYFQF